MEPGDRRGDRRPLLALMAANAISQVGNMMTVVAVPWFVLETTGSAAQVGLVSAAVAIGTVLPAILGGPMVDRLGVRRTSIGADALCSLIILLIPVLHLLGVLQFWMLTLLVFAHASVNAQGDTGRLSMLPVLARRADMTPERSNSIDRAVARMGQLVGPVLAGVLIALIGPANVLFADTLTFGASAALVLVGVTGPVKAAGAERRTGAKGYGADLAEGLRFVAGNRLLLFMVLLATFGNFLDVPLLQVALPVYANEVFGSPTALGLLLGSFAGGALTGTILYGMFGRGLPRRATLLTSWLTATLIIYGALLLQPPLAVLVVLGLVGGAATGPINPIMLTVIQAETPAAFMGRVFGALNALAQAGIPFGAAIIGLLIEGAGLLETMAGMGALYALTIAVMFAVPALRRMDAAGAEPATEPPVEAAPASQARRCATMKAGL